MMTAPPLIKSLYANIGFTRSSSSRLQTLNIQYVRVTNLLIQLHYECLRSSSLFV